MQAAQRWGGLQQRNSLLSLRCPGAADTVTISDMLQENVLVRIDGLQPESTLNVKGFKLSVNLLLFNKVAHNPKESKQPSFGFKKLIRLFKALKVTLQTEVINNAHK